MLSNMVFCLHWQKISKLMAAFSVMCAILLCQGYTTVSLAQTLTLDAVPQEVQESRLPGSFHQQTETEEFKHVKGQEKPNPEKEATEDVLSGDEIKPPQEEEGSAYITVGKIKLIDNTVLNPKKVKAIMAPYQSQKLQIKDLQKLSHELRTLYIQEGYITSRVIIPEQEVVDQTITLQAVEGTVGKINYKKGTFFLPHAYKGRIDTDNKGVFNVVTLKNSLRRINENPDLNLFVKMEEGSEYGTTDLDVEVQDKNTFHITPYWDNLGRRLIGRKRMGLTVKHNNLLTLGDENLSSISWTRRSFGYVNQYRVPVGKHGTKLGFDYAYSSLKLGDELTKLHITGGAITYSPSLTQELYRAENALINMTTSFDFKQQYTHIDHPQIQLKREDKVRVWRTAVNGDFYDRFGKTMARAEVGWGLPLFGANHGEDPNVSRKGADGKFVTLLGSLTRMQKLPYHTMGIFRATGQFSPDKLVSAEQFQAGGAFTVRGYKEGVLIGDNGFLLNAEIYTPAYFIPKKWTVPFTQINIRDRVQLLGFADFAGIYSYDPQPNVDPQDYLLGAGVGVRVNLTQYISARLDLGVPFLRHDIDRMGAKLHFGLQSKLF